MIPANFKVNVYTYTRIPRPAELFRRSGFSEVSNLGLYDNEGSAVSGRKIDLIAKEYQKLEDAISASDE